MTATGCEVEVILSLVRDSSPRLIPGSRMSEGIIGAGVTVGSGALDEASLAVSGADGDGAGTLI